MQKVGDGAKQNVSSGVAGHTRNLLQGRNREVVVTSEREIQEAFSNLRINQTILLDVAQVVLSETLVVNVSGVTIEGSRSGRTLLQCPPDSSRPALIIQYS